MREQIKVTERLQAQWRQQLSQLHEEREYSQSGRKRDAEDVALQDHEIKVMGYLLALPLGSKFNGQDVEELLVFRGLAGKTVEIIGVLPDDPNPLEVGDRGLVKDVTNDQATVVWKSGRTLMLIPGDPYRVVSS